MEVSETAKPIRILHLLHENNFEWPLIENLILGLDNQQFEQTICYICGEASNPSKLDSNGFDVISFGIPKNRLNRFQPRVVSRIAKILDSQEIDIIHCQRHKPTLYGTLATFLCKRKVAAFTTVHGEGYFRRFRRKLINFILLNRAARVIGVSDAVTRDIVRSIFLFSPKKVKTVYNGIVASEFTSKISPSEARNRLGLPREDVTVFGTIGRLTRIKGHSELLKAFARVFRGHADCWLIIVGSGEMADELQALATELGIDSRTKFLGYRTDIADVLRALDFFVFPSLTEGFGLALLESMAAGIPVIASAVGGIPEILHEPLPGIMVPPGNIDELAEEMERVCAWTEKKKGDVGEQLMNRVDSEFSVSSMANGMSTQYREALDDNRT